MNVVHACSSKWSAAQVRLSQNFLRHLTSHLLDSFFQQMTQTAENSDSAVQSTNLLQEPIQTNSEMNSENKLRVFVHCLQQWLYHTKMARACTEQRGQHIFYCYL